MSQSCSPSDLLGQSGCFQCVPPGTRGLIKLALYCRLANGVTTPCDLQTLLTEASCFQCLSEGQRTIARLVLLCNILGMTPVQPLNPIDLLAGLVSWWKMDEATAAPRLDSSGNNNTLTDSNGDVTQQVGMINQAAGFLNLSNSQKLVGVTTPSIRLAANDTLSVSAWVYWFGNVSADVLKLRRPGGQIVFDFFVGGDGVFWIQFAGNVQFRGTKFGVIPPNVWNWVLVELDPPNGTGFIRVNDNDVYQNTFHIAPFTNVNGGIDEFPEVGSSGLPPASFSGRIDDVRFYKNRLLTPSTITALYNFR